MTDEKPATVRISNGRNTMSLRCAPGTRFEPGDSVAIDGDGLAVRGCDPWVGTVCGPILSTARTGVPQDIDARLCALADGRPVWWHRMRIARDEAAASGRRARMAQGHPVSMGWSGDASLQGMQILRKAWFVWEMNRRYW